MPRYSAKIKVNLKEGVTDPEANSVKNALNQLGFREIYEVKRSIVYDIKEIEATTYDTAYNKAEEICKKLLTNPVKDDYEIEIKIESS
ncbi:MAG: phosphoribosylformylglycinamidine synthase subunit PurS [Methanosarcinales archaeon]